MSKELMQGEDKVDWMVIFTRPDCTDDAANFAEDLMDELVEAGMPESCIYIDTARAIQDRILNINEVTVGMHKTGTPEDEIRLAYMSPIKEETTDELR